ncbi:phytanoyl-CoA dioxygenase family protein [bacterium AH-315-E10]|nr:phytanoyl-CoA dioxygenase family protein [bacterium AH-315-E10]
MICYDSKVVVPTILDECDVEFFIENGYLVVENMIQPDELDALETDLLKLARGGYPCDTFKAVDAGMSDDDVLKDILCIHQPHYISPVIDAHVRHKDICGALSQITAAHLPHWDGSVKCMQSMYFCKPPGFQGQAWHQDEIYIPTRDRSLIGAWTAIDDATVENGTIWVIPGSHKSGYLHAQKAHENPDEFDFAPMSYGFDESEEIPVEVKKGAVVFFNGYLLHRSAKNRSVDYRKVLVNHYCNAWSLLPWHVSEGEGAATADVRRIIPVAGIDPYAWKGVEKPLENVHVRTCSANKDSLENKKKDETEPVAQ